MTEIRVGDRIIDEQYGPCRVTFIGSEYLGLCTENDQHALVKKDRAELRPWSQEGEAAWLGAVPAAEMEESRQTDTPWPASTFFLEPEGTQHFLGSHWDPFEEHRADAIMQQLPEILEKMAEVEGFGDMADPPRQLPEEWESGYHVIWPKRDKGVIFTFAVNKAEDRLELASMFPFHAGDQPHRLILDTVLVWENGVEAQIHTDLGDASISFYDAHYLLNRGWYEHGREYAFILTGIAYNAGPARATEIPYTPNPEQIAWEAALARESGEEPREISGSLSLEGAAFFLAISEWDVDDYSFRGPIKTVVPCTDFLDQDGWLVTVTILRLEKDVDLHIVITSRAWEGDAPPQVGMDIEGRLWLQGYLKDVP